MKGKAQLVIHDPNGNYIAPWLVFGSQSILEIIQ
jgi:hypothetical protein